MVSHGISLAPLQPFLNYMLRPLQKYLLVPANHALLTVQFSVDGKILLVASEHSITLIEHGITVLSLPPFLDTFRV